jgi:tetratricopeptide (TPR) repeat protein
MRKNSSYKLFYKIVFLLLLFLPAISQAQLRKVEIGGKMPQIALKDLNDVEYLYRHDSNKVLVMFFLSDKPLSQKAAENIPAIMEEFEEHAQSFDFVIVITSRDGKEFLNSLQQKDWPNFHILLDDKYKLWGDLGMIAMPTILIAAKDNTLQWAKAGYSYDFLPLTRQNLKKALGIINGDQVSDEIEVRTLTNKTDFARLQRHLQMAKILEEKGNLELAISEVNKAHELDPNSVLVKLELGRLYCIEGEGGDALKAIAEVEAQGLLQMAKVELIMGWANRLLEQYDIAEKHLKEAVRLDRRSTRSYFELGKTYQAMGENNKALETYYKALSLVFGEKPSSTDKKP